MGIEIERKFLVHGERWRDSVHRSRAIEQGYLSNEPGKTIRVRVEDQRASLNIKGQPTGLSRSEFEYEIPVEEGRQILSEFCEGRRLKKTRHHITVGDHLWEVDEFFGANAGLVVAEVELRREDESFVRPEWVGDEVTGQVRYYNARLVETPVEKWSSTEQ